MKCLAWSRYLPIWIPWLVTVRAVIVMTSDLHSCDTIRLWLMLHDGHANFQLASLFSSLGSPPSSTGSCPGWSNWWRKPEASARISWLFNGVWLQPFGPPTIPLVVSCFQVLVLPYCFLFNFNICPSTTQLTHLVTCQCTVRDLVDSLYAIDLVNQIPLLVSLTNSHVIVVILKSILFKCSPNFVHLVPVPSPNSLSAQAASHLLDGLGSKCCSPFWRRSDPDLLPTAARRPRLRYARAPPQPVF